MKTTTQPSRRSSTRVLRRVVASAVFGIASLTTLQAIEPTGSPAAAAESDECGPVLTTADGSKWNCTFVDNFDGSSIDRNKWLVQQTKVTGFFSGQTCFVDSDRNIVVEGGELKLITREESSDYNCTSFGGFETDYTGGMIGTKTKFSQTYGRFEVRAKFPAVSTAGVHGGF